MAATFLAQEEDEATIRKLLQIFKERNPKYKQTLVAMTNKNMTERNVIISEMPHICLQICLIHVLRTFGREITPGKMGIYILRRKDHSHRPYPGANLFCQ